MIATIGLMIWAYCTARLIAIAAKDGGGFVKAIAGIVIAIALVVLAYGCLDLHLRGAATPGMP